MIEFYVQGANSFIRKDQKNSRTKLYKFFFKSNILDIKSTLIVLRQQTNDRVLANGGWREKCSVVLPIALKN